LIFTSAKTEPVNPIIVKAARMIAFFISFLPFTVMNFCGRHADNRKANVRREKYQKEEWKVDSGQWTIEEEKGRANCAAEL